MLQPACKWGEVHVLPHHFGLFVGMVAGSCWVCICHWRCCQDRYILHSGRCDGQGWLHCFLTSGLVDDGAIVVYEEARRMLLCSLAAALLNAFFLLSHDSRQGDSTNIFAPGATNAKAGPVIYLTVIDVA